MKEILSIDCPENEPLCFHQITASNIILMNNSRTARRKDTDEWGLAGVFTQRPLIDEEIFQVELQEVDDEHDWSLGIGVVAVSPDEIISMPQWMRHLQHDHWFVYGHADSYYVWKNGEMIISKFGTLFRKPKVGDKFGVARTKDGNLIFFINEIYQGIADSNIPQNVYGIAEVRNHAVCISIV